MLGLTPTAFAMPAETAAVLLCVAANADALTTCKIKEPLTFEILVRTCVVLLLALLPLIELVQ